MSIVVNAPTALVVDDEEIPRQLLSSELESIGFRVCQAEDGVDGLARFKETNPCIVVTDKNMPRKDGIELLCDIRSLSSTPVVVLTAYGSIPSAVDAMKLGATEFIASSDIEMDGLVALIKETAARWTAGASADELEAAYPGASNLSARLRKRLSVFSRLDSPVLVRGARGADKTRLVRLMHERGPSAGGRLLEIDAEGFEVGALPSDVTAVHLREIERLSAATQDLVGSRGSIPRQGSGTAGSVRLFASTSRPDACDSLEYSIAEALSQFVLEIPDLRDHPEDLRSIVSIHLERTARSLNAPPFSVSEDAMARLEAERWPGNERELYDVLERAAVLSPSDTIEVSAIEMALDEGRATIARIRKLDSNRERGELLAALESAGGSVTGASRVLGTSRSAIYRLMDKHGIPRERRN